MTVSLGLVGTGTVGGGCLDILAAHKEDFERHFGVDVKLVRVCSRQPEVAAAHGCSDIFTEDYHDVVNDPEVDIVVELIGGTTTAFDVIASALKAGKSVVTANKAIMSTRGAELFALAEQSGVELAFEASVGGGIPIIGPLKHSLIANGISSVVGIVNGTTNYMLTRMGEDGLSYDEALREAQQLGYAEADPTADVDGLDSAAKIAILASIAFNSRVTRDDVHTEGIRSISPVDLRKANEMGYAVKLLAIAHRRPEGIDVRVQPTMIPLTHQLASVKGVFNAVYVVGDFVGETMFFGEGAGSGPAASAVMGDVVDVARRIQQGKGPDVGCTCVDSLPIMPIDTLQTRYYLRFVVPDRAGVLAAASKIFSKYDVSLQSVMQEGTRERNAVDLIFVTHTAQEASIRQVIDELMQLDGTILAQPTVIRLED